MGISPFFYGIIYIGDKMRPIIGIVSSIKNNNDVIYSDNVLAIEKALGEPIGLITNIDDYVSDVILEECDGFLFQGGVEMENFQLNILRYAYLNNKPVLGICLGMELIANNFFGFGSVNKIDDLNIKSNINHHMYFENYVDKSVLVHSITTTPSSWLNSIIGDQAMVNSRHTKTVVKVEKPFIVSALSDDGIIEGIEYIDESHFVIGVQFHPENIENLQIIFNEFVRKCKEMNKNIL